MDIHVVVIAIGTIVIFLLSVVLIKVIRDRNLPRIRYQEAQKHHQEFYFSSEALKKLDELLLASGLKTRVEVLRSALGLYDWYLEEMRGGWKIQLVNGDTVRKVEFKL